MVSSLGIFVHSAQYILMVFLFILLMIYKSVCSLRCIFCPNAQYIMMIFFIYSLNYLQGVMSVCSLHWIFCPNAQYIMMIFFIYSFN